MNKPAIIDKIKVARQELSDAEGDVAQVLSALTRSVRADKSMIGEALEAAVAKVKLASKDLVELEKLIESTLE